MTKTKGEARVALQEIHIVRLTKFLAETKAYFNQRIAEFASEVDQSIIFKPSREQQMKMLSKIPHMAEKMLRLHR